MGGVGAEGTASSPGEEERCPHSPLEKKAFVEAGKALVIEEHPGVALKPRRSGRGAGLSGSRGDRTFNDSIIQLVGTGSHPGCFVVSSSTRPRLLEGKMGVHLSRDQCAHPLPP